MTHGYKRRIYGDWTIEFDLQPDGHVRITKAKSGESTSEVYVPGETLIELGEWLVAVRRQVQIERLIQGRRAP